ncbi:hypothetical protein EKK97_13875 [Billgrantia tianxiuensis]|uniref:HTH luxR-type domain-containing protein n=1 Tax=Billgrantia tianxiuensis TaxID=2497861 RepID=A0A6I6SU06_9GAMM|nr:MULTISPECIES: LuxR C-terminal-related transcriptional regulator [Halomonas]MCE8034586.1 hypothetical protein [Halomonas sp. MCCC 1A11057]QHC50453.1 hypothetical protein EKK97_13875 [Halomonas tianxiuensis]
MEITFGNWAAQVDETRGSQGLTPMEARYLLCVVNGMTQKEAAKATGRQPNTVKKGLERAYAKLRVSRATAAVARAQALGWIRPVARTLLCAVLAIAIGTGGEEGIRRGGRTHRLTRRETEVQIFA